MEEKHNEATPQRPEGARTLDAPLVTIDVGSLLKQIKQEVAWENSDRNTITVYKNAGMRIVMIALQAGAELKTHTAPGIISVQVLEGHLTFTTEAETVDLGVKQMLALHAGIPHSVRAHEESVFLLTLALG